jgi:membrane-bound lytic murein transglycosylase MltF
MYSPWPVAVAMTESSLGVNQKSPTGAKGVFQMTSIAMKDLLLEMENKNDDVVDILCGTAFLYLLLKRWGTIEEATAHYCDPKDRDFYVERVMNYIKLLTEE